MLRSLVGREINKELLSIKGESAFASRIIYVLGVLAWYKGAC